MIGLYRAGRWAGALAFFALIANSTQAAASTGRVEQTFAAAPAVQPMAQTQISPIYAVQPLQTYSPPVVAPQAAQPPAAPVARSLRELVAAFVDRRDQDQEQLCLAKAVYFEARGESLEGQLAVAQVVLNRAASGRYPATLCGVVTQPWQFSFIRRGAFPAVNSSSPAWSTALAIADIARNRVAAQIPSNVLWYHANYVAPSWGRRLTRVAQIGAHIFYG